MSVPLFSALGLSSESLKAIERLGFEQPSPVQAESIPLILAGHDVVGQSQTGSGKTAAFALPAIEKVDPSVRAVQILVLCNTRELAVQVSEEMRKLSHFKPGIRPLPIYGGQSYDRQIAGLRSGANIVIGTPGRIMDHMQRGTLVLGSVKMAILDEADEMLNMGFRDDIEHILKAVPKERQTVLFSATIPRPIEELIAHHTRDPRRVRIQAKALTVPTIEQVYVEVDRRWKAEALERLIDVHDVTRGLIFCNTQRMVDELTENLNAAGYGADAIHGGMAQSQRDRVMKKFKSGGLEFLVATDIAARGIDVDDIQVVFNFDMPYDGEDYVHRIGRTGRAGRSGIAISLVSGRERFAIQQLERFTRQRLRKIDVPTHGEIEQARMQQLMQSVRATIAAGDFRHYDHLIEGLLEEGIDSLDLTNALLHHISNEEVTKDRPSEKLGERGDAIRTSAASTPRPARKEVRPAPPAVAPEEPVADDAIEESDAPTAPPISREHRPAPRPAPADAGNSPSKPVSPAFPRPAAPSEFRRPASPTADSRPRDSHSAPGYRDERRPARPDFERRPPSEGPARFPARPATVPRPPRGEFRRSPEEEFPSVRNARRNRSDAPGFRGPYGGGARPGPVEMTRLWLGLGEGYQVGPADIKGCILGETGLPTEAVGRIEMGEKHAFVEVSSEHVGGILAKLKRARLGGRGIKARTA